MSAAFSLGVTLLSNTAATKVTLTEKIETKTYPLADSSFGGGQSFDPIFDFSAEGYGTNPYSFATAPAFAAVSTGKVIVEMYGTTAKNDDHQQWKVSGKIFPSAT